LVEEEKQSEDIDEEGLLDYEEIQDFKELRKKAVNSFLEKGKLFYSIMEFMKINKGRISSEEIKELLEKEKTPEEESEDEEFEKAINLCNSNNYGKWIAEATIKNYVIKKKKELNNIIDLFFKEFGDSI